MGDKSSKGSGRKPTRVAAYGSALDYRRDEAALVGQIIAKWNVVEFECVNILADALGCSKRVAEQLIYAVPSSSARINVIQAAVLAQLASFDAGEQVASTIGTLVGRIQKCLQTRNLLAHGIYATENGQLRSVKVKEGFFNDSKERPMTLAQLKSQLVEMSDLLPQISKASSLVRDARQEFWRKQGQPS